MEKKEEEKGAVALDTAGKIKQLEDSMPHVKLDMEDKEALKEIFNAGLSLDEENEKVTEFIQQLSEKLKLNKNMRGQRELEKIAPLYDTHDFWESQPVPKHNEEVKLEDYDKAIDVVKKVSDIQAEPLDIPEGFHWSVVNIEDDEECKEVYDLLTQNYVEDDDNMFRFDYSIKFLQWALTPPGYKKDWLFGVRGGKKNKLFGFISGIPVHMNVNGK